MIDEYLKQRSLIDPDRKVEVYRNLHKKCWSVRQDGLVKFHCAQVFVRDCKFVVQPAGRAKALSEKRKNVHAFVRGYLRAENLPSNRPEIENSNIWDNISYNPYKADTFVDSLNNPVCAAMFVDLEKEVIALQLT